VGPLFRPGEPIVAAGAQRGVAGGFTIMRRSCPCAAGDLLANLIVLHLLAVGYHQLVRRDRLLSRMLFARATERPGREPDR
jgi:hypothetical protein